MNYNGVTDDELNLIITGILHINELTLAKALLAEREEREKMQDVWKDAPESADRATVEWFDFQNSTKLGKSRVYTRTLPKTRAREIAEKYGKDLYGEMGETWADRFEKAILEYAEGKNV